MAEYPTLMMRTRDLRPRGLSSGFRNDMHWEVFNRGDLEQLNEPTPLIRSESGEGSMPQFVQVS